MAPTTPRVPLSKVEKYTDGSLSLHDPDYPAAGCKIVSAIMITAR